MEKLSTVWKNVKIIWAIFVFQEKFPKCFVNSRERLKSFCHMGAKSVWNYCQSIFSGKFSCRDKEYLQIKWELGNQVGKYYYATLLASPKTKCKIIPCCSNRHLLS